ncbi:endonuclease III [Candidatus Bathyarchaeota archaeon]|jgi:endonuclease III|nr:endonuclease III [Candidatus Bathyarchaeota archaeon]MBT4320271.1 endonuclease III [Candidatus Bathyarchaeota archaeon]MBT4424828.1 endonuclease III [Candidatus Bathyarchaeota archaeon]MBT6605911.1 endonuclease III [Candidatus Bathyarchaeota archaeon]MBT7187127.1 endonuclease III [Candidatus Bathyarchaeota archaeon]
MNDRERAHEVIRRLEEEYPSVEGTELTHHTPLELLVATVLSAQATDTQINKVTKELFKKYKTVEDYAGVPREELEQDIRSSGFFRRKADAIQTLSQTLIDEHDGQVPDNMKDLVKLKGVGRKTANIVLAGSFGKIVGIAVDTHVHRLSRLLGLSDQKNPVKVERELMELFPQEKWWAVNYMLITHGRRVCDAKKPNCEGCLLTNLCPSAFTFKRALVR